MELERRAQSSGEWPCVRTTCLEGLVGLEECEGGGASVEEPGCRGWRRDGRGDSRELVAGSGARVGGRGGGAIRVEGRGGGAIRPEGVVVDFGWSGGTEGVVPDGILGSCGARLSSSCPESVKVGTLSLRAVAEAFGVVSGSSCGRRTVGGGGGGMASPSGAAMAPFRGLTVLPICWSAAESSSRAIPASSVVRFSCDTDGRDCGPGLGACRHEPKNDSNHCGRRKQKSTAEASIRDIPRTAIADTGLGPRDAEMECERVLSRHLM